MAPKDEKGAMSLTGGERFALVPAVCLQDPTLSRGARWLYAVLASYADAGGITIHLALSTIAKREGITVRRIEQWLAELAKVGWAGRIVAPGSGYQYMIARDPAKRDDVIARTGMAMILRAVKAAKRGAMGAAERRRRGYQTKRRKVADSSANAPKEAKPVSPGSETDFAGSAKLVSPTQDVFKTPPQEQEEVSAGAAARCASPDGSASGGACAERSQPTGKTCTSGEATDCLQGAPVAESSLRSLAARRRKEAERKFNEDVLRIDGLMAAIMTMPDSTPAWEAAVQAEMAERGAGLRELKDNWLEGGACHGSEGA